MKMLCNDIKCTQTFEYDASNRIKAIKITANRQIRLAFKNVSTDTYEIKITGNEFILDEKLIKKDTIYQYVAQTRDILRYKNITSYYYLLYHNNGFYIYERKPSFEVYKDDLMYTRRHDVTLLPYQPIPCRTGNTAYALTGAYEKQKPIPEACRLTMGCQLFLFSPYQEAASSSNDVVIYGGFPNPGYGHFLLDAMARLWFAKDHPDIPIIWDSEKLPTFAPAIFEIVGIRNRHLFLKKTTRFKEVIFPFPGVSIGNYFLSGHEKFLGAYPGKPVIPGKKIYLSRKNIKGRNLVNEELIEALLSSYGFIIYYPEEHSIAEQLDEISSSEVVLGAEGSAMHSVVLLKRPVRTRFYAIARHRMGSGIFEHIRLLKNIQYTTFNISLENKRISSDDELNIDIEKLKHILSETNGFSEEKAEVLDKYIVTPNSPQTYFLDVLNKFSITLTEAEATSLHILHMLKDYFDKLETLKKPIEKNNSPENNALCSFLTKSKQDILSKVASQLAIKRLIK